MAENVSIPILSSKKLQQLLISITVLLIWTCQVPQVEWESADGVKTTRPLAPSTQEPDVSHCQAVDMPGSALDWEHYSTNEKKEKRMGTWHK